MEENNAPNEEVKATIDFINKVMDERSPCQKEIESYKKQMVVGMVYFMVLFGLSLCYCIISEDLGVQIIALCFMVIESLLMVWWITHFSKMINEGKDALKSWQSGLSDAYNCVIETEMMLYKAKRRNEKKKIEEEGTLSNETIIDENKIKEIVKQQLNELVGNERKDNSKKGWFIHIFKKTKNE